MPQRKVSDRAFCNLSLSFEKAVKGGFFVVPPAHTLIVFFYRDSMVKPMHKQKSKFYRKRYFAI